MLVILGLQPLIFKTFSLSEEHFFLTVGQKIFKRENTMIFLLAFHDFSLIFIYIIELEYFKTQILH